MGEKGVSERLIWRITPAFGVELADDLRGRPAPFGGFDQGPAGGPDDSAVKINILHLTFLQAADIKGFTVPDYADVPDSPYVRGYRR